MRRIGLTSIGWLCLLLLAPISAVDFDPLPAAVWEMKKEPEEGIAGAVVLEDALFLKWNRLERVYGVRILSDSGRAAAEFPPFREEAAGIKGRVVYPDDQSGIDRRGPPIPTLRSFVRRFGEGREV